MSSANDEAARREKFVHHVRFFDAAVRCPAPYIGFTGEPGHRFEHHCLPYDANGFLNPMAAGPRTDPEEIRIFVVGDSTMLAGTEWWDTVPGRIHDLLRKTHSPCVQVYNFGAVSSCTEQMCALIWTRLLDLDPDLIAVVSGGTDAFQPLNFDPRPGYPYNAFITEFLYTHYFDVRNDGAWQAGLDYDAVIAAAFDLHTRLREQVKYGSEDWERTVAQSYETSLRKLARLARAVQIPVVYFLEPIVVRKHKRAASEESLALPEALAFLARQYDRFEAILKDARANGLPGNLRLVDASRALDEIGPGLFYDIVHYDRPGRETVGQYAADQLLEALRARPVQTPVRGIMDRMRGLLRPASRRQQAG